MSSNIDLERDFAAGVYLSEAQKPTYPPPTPAAKSLYRSIL